MTEPSLKRPATTADIVPLHRAAPPAAYFGLSGEAATAARLTAERLGMCVKRTSEDMITIGEELLAIKPLLAGQFLNWWESETGLSARMAQQLMRVAEQFGDRARTKFASQDGTPEGRTKFATDGAADGTRTKFASVTKSELSSLPAPKVLMMIAAPSTPDDVRQEVLGRAADGEKITVAEVKRLKDEAKAATERADKAESAAKARSTEIEFLRTKLDEKPNQIVVEKQVVPDGYTCLRKAVEAETRKRIEAEYAVAIHRDEIADAERQLDSLRFNIKHAEASVAALSDKAATGGQLALLKLAWEHAGPEARQQFLDEVEQADPGDDGVWGHQ